ATWVARRPIGIDFSCGFQSNLSAGMRSRTALVVLPSFSNSAIRAAAMLFVLVAVVPIVYLLTFELVLVSLSFIAQRFHRCNIKITLLQKFNFFFFCLNWYNKFPPLKAS